MQTYKTVCAKSGICGGGEMWSFSNCGDLEKASRSKVTFDQGIEERRRC